MFSKRPSAQVANDPTPKFVYYRTVQILPLSELIRQRRNTLGLKQQQIADELRVVPESIGNWERGKRRIELDRVPPLAAILQLNEQDVCRLAQFEVHPRLYATLLGADHPPQPRHIQPCATGDDGASAC